MIQIADQEMVAQILETGAYLYSLIKNGKEILLRGREDRKTHGGMALLIPYANRVKGGKYVWEGKEYELPRNKEGNAIHGLVLDKQFSVLDKGDDYAVLQYILTHQGYPTKLSIRVMYSLNKGLETRIEITNIGESSAPLMVGAHPYFIVKGDWKLYPSSVQKCIMENMIPTGETVDFNVIKGEYDDCFIIVGDVTLESEYSKITIRKDYKMNFIQLYTGEPNAVAVEPMSAAPDAYHNGMGLMTLRPKEIKEFYFKIEVNT